MDSWWRQGLNGLPVPVWWQLADSLDVPTATGLGYPRFAAELRFSGSQRYTAQEIALIRERSQGSTTFALLRDYEARGGTIQGVQYALQAIGHVAQTIIPAYLQIEREALAQSRLYPHQYPPYDPGYPWQFHSGNQQTEGSICNCPRCQEQYQTSGYSSGRSGRSDPVQRQISSPLGSVYTRNSGSGNRRRHQTEPNPSGSPVTGSGLNSRLTGDSNGGSSRNIIQNSNKVGQGLPVAGLLPNRSTGNENLPIRGPNPPAPVGEMNCSPCQCEDCRLGSDPEQTRRLTLESDPKAPCRFNPGYLTPQNRGENISSGFSQLYLDSSESSETSVEDVENSDETFVKGLLSESDSEQNTDMNSTTESVQTGQVSSNERRLCAKSHIGQHWLGDRIADCSVCRMFAGAKPKNVSRPRNNSAPQKTEVADTDLRKSWHGSSGHSKNKQMKKILSDSVLSVSHNPNISKSAGQNANKSGENSIESTLYARISPHNSLSGRILSRSTSIAGNTSSARSTACNSYAETYKNNLESVDARPLTDPPICSRNINPSDSSNCSGPQNETSDMYKMASSSTPMTAPYSLPNEPPSNEQIRNNYDNNAQRDSVPSAGAQRGGQSTDSAQSGDRGIGGSDRRSGDGSGRPGDSDGGSNGFVFVTYSWNGHTDREEFIQEVIIFCQKLKQAGIRVKIDMDEASYAALRLNKLDWIDRNVREAKYVIVCITPTYAADTREPDRRNQASPRSGQLNARYIFDKLREEYYSNQSQNRRTIPVMFSNYGTTADHIPSCMRSTLIYKYPQYVEQIIEAIVGHGSFRPS